MSKRLENLLETEGRGSSNFLHWKKNGKKVVVPQWIKGFLTAKPVEMKPGIVGGVKRSLRKQYRLQQEDGSVGVFELSLISHRIANEDVEHAAIGDLVGFKLEKVVTNAKGHTAYWIKGRTVKVAPKTKKAKKA